MTAKNVLENYIKAIGREKAVAVVKSIAMVGSTSIPQAPAPLSYTSKIDTKGNSLVELSMGGMSVMKQIINQKGAYAVQQGQRKDFTGVELAEMKASATPFEEVLLLKNPSLAIDRIESINGNDAFAIKNGKTTYFYDTKTGLKLAESKSIEQEGQTMTVTTNFADYKEVKSVKAPFNIIQNVGIELNIKLSEITINEGVKDTDFQ